MQAAFNARAVHTPLTQSSHAPHGAQPSEELEPIPLDTWAEEPTDDPAETPDDEEPVMVALLDTPPLEDVLPATDEDIPEVPPPLELVPVEDSRGWQVWSTQL